MLDLLEVFLENALGMDYRRLDGQTAGECAHDSNSIRVVTSL
eukprot:COSAG01_NODE_2608_length_7388_cov_2.860200_3_plen_42_part_00